MQKKDIDWSKLGFGYTPTDYRFEAHWKDGKWDEGKMITDPNIELSEAACVFHYAQCCFEGLKAYTTVKGDIVTFRPDLNAERMMGSAERLEMPAFPKEKFIQAVKDVVAANAAWVPPYGTGATLYIRPVMIGSGPQIGLAREFIFRIFVMPVGAYFKGAIKPLKLTVPEFDRAAPRGTGHIKAGLNYAMSLHPTMEAHRHGYAENIYLDPATRTYIEETGGANVIFITKDGGLVTPQSPTILPSITRRSLLYVAEHYLHISAVERPVRLDEIGDFSECGLCGTAAVISPVGTIDDHGTEYHFGVSEERSVIRRLYTTLLAIQHGEIPAPDGWLVQVD